MTTEINSYFKHNLFNPSPPKLSFLSLWFGLLIDKKKEVNVFQIKKNKLIYCLTNIRVFLTYIVPILILIAEIVVICINVNHIIKFCFLVIPIAICVLVTIFETGRYSRTYPLTFECITNIYYLIHSKYLVDKFLYFYRIDLSEFATKKLVKNSDKFPLITIKYFNEKDISKLKIISNIKNSGKICKIYIKDKEKAIKLMKRNIDYFYILAKYIIAYSSVFSAIFVIICVIYIPFIFQK